MVVVERDTKVGATEDGRHDNGLWKWWRSTVEAVACAEIVARCLDAGRNAKMGEGEHNTPYFMHEVHDAPYIVRCIIECALLWVNFH